MTMTEHGKAIEDIAPSAVEPINRLLGRIQLVGEV